MLLLMSVLDISSLKKINMATTDYHRTVSKSSNRSSTKGQMLTLRRRSSSILSSPRYPMSPFTGKRITEEDELKQVFRYFDSDGDGRISALDLRAYFGSIGEYMSYEEAQGAIDEVDSDRDSLLDFHDFMKMMKIDPQEEEDLKRAFKMFELEKKGCITPRGLQKMLDRLGDSKSYDECVAMIQVFDTDGNGVIDYREFSEMMAKN